MRGCVVMGVTLGLALLLAGCGVPAEEHALVQAQLKKMTQENADLKQQVDGFAAKMDDAEKATAAEKQRADGLQDQLTAATNKLSDTIVALSAAQKAKDAAASGLAAADKIKAERDAAQAELAQAKQQITDLIAQNALLKDGKAKAEQAADTANKAKEAMRKKVEALGGDVSKYLDTIPTPEPKTDQPQ